MPAGPLAVAVAHLGAMARPPDPRTDAALVAAFARTRDEAAATELVRRHGPTVLGVCRRLHPAEADDCFQAVWLVFSRKAGRVRPPGAVGVWLYGVAVKVAMQARNRSMNRRRRLMALSPPAPTVNPVTDPLLTAVLDEELARLPDKYRRTVLLCDVGGKTRLEAAAELGWPAGTVATRLLKGRGLLADRLRRRGVTLPVAGLAAVLAPEALAAPVPATLAAAAVRLLLSPAVIPASLLPLVHNVRPALTTPATWKLLALGLLAGVGLTAGGVGLAPTRDKPADAPNGAGEWELAATLTDHGGRVEGAAFAADGYTFTTLGAAGKAIVWDAATLAKRHALDVWDGGPRPAASDPRVVPWQTLRPRPDGKLTVIGYHVPTDLYAVLDPANGRVERAADFTGTHVVPRVPDAAKAERAVMQRPGTDAGHWTVSVPWLVTVSPDGKWAAVAEHLIPPQDGHEGAVGVCDARTGKSLATLRCRRSMPRAIAWSPDGKRLATGGLGELILWDTAKLAEEARGPGDVPFLTAAVFTPDGLHLVVGGTSHDGDNPPVGMAEVRPVPGLKPAERLDIGPAVGVSDFAVSPDGRTLVAALGCGLNPQWAKAGGEVRVYRRKPKPAEPPAPKPAPGGWKRRAVPDAEGAKQPRAVAFTPDGRFLVTGDPKQRVSFWTLGTDPLRSNELSLGSGDRDERPAAVAVAPGGRVIAFTRFNGYCVLEPDPGCWRLGLPKGQPVPPGYVPPPPELRPPDRVYHVVQTADRKPAALAFSPDGKRVADTDGRGVWVRAVGAADDQVVLNPAGDEQVPRPAGRLGPDRPAGVAWAADGRRLAFLPNIQVAGQFVVLVWGAGSGAPMGTLPHPARPTAVAWVGDKLVTADAAGTVRLWHPGTLAEAGRFDAGGAVEAVAVRADGRQFAVGVADRVRVWDAGEGWAKSADLSAGGVVRSVAFDPAGGVLAAGTDAGLAVWDRPPPAPLPKPDPARAALDSGTPLKDHRQMVYDAAFSADGKRFASVGADGQVIVWDAASLKPTTRFEVTKNLPPEPPQLTASLPNPPDLRVWWRANGLRVRFGDEYADFRPGGQRQAGGPAPAGATPLSDGERVVVRLGTAYAVTQLDGGGLPVRLDVAPKLVGLTHAAFTADGRLVAVAELHPDISTRLRVLDTATGKALADRPISDPKGATPAALAVSRDGTQVVCGLNDSTLIAWDAPGWAERYRLAPGSGMRDGPITALAFSGDGRQLYDAGWFNSRGASVLGIPLGPDAAPVYLRVRDALTGRSHSGSVTHFRGEPTGMLDFDRNPMIDRLVVSPDGGTVLAPQGSAARGSNTQTVAGQRAKATRAELLVYRRTSD